MTTAGKSIRERLSTRSFLTGDENCQVAKQACTPPIGTSTKHNREEIVKI